MHHIISNNPSRRKRLVRIPNFADENYFQPSPQPNNEVFSILLPKMPSYDRGTDLAILAVKKIINDRGEDSVELLIVGDSADTEIFKNMAIELKVDRQIKFLGHRDHFEDMPALYKKADVVIVPSPWREATALAMLEGMASGRPVVVSAIGGLTEVVIDGFNGCLISADENSLASALVRLMDDYDLREKLGENAGAWISEYYSKEKWLREIDRFFS